jgi:glycosyltransferase involved in cell wall biosynthesis
MASALDLLIVADGVDGGLGSSALAHGRWFAAQGWQVALAAPGLPRGEICGLRAVSLPKADSALDAAAVWRVAMRLRAEMRQLGPTVVHAHGTRAELFCVLAGRRPYVTMHGSGGRVPGQTLVATLARRVGRGLAPLLARRAYSAAPAGGGWSTMLQASPRLPELGAIVPAAVTGPAEFLWLGRLDVPKQPLTFVRACAAASRLVDLHGVVVGEGPLRPVVEAEARRLQAPVTFVGHTNDIVGHLERAWAVCLFSAFEGVPFALQEAMWAGRAVVLSPLPSLRWFAGDVAAYAADAEQAGEALQVLADPRVAQARGAAAAARVRTLLSPGDPYPRLLVEYRASRR